MIDLEKIKSDIALAERMGAQTIAHKNSVALLTELERVNKMLTYLTAGGSEYYNDPDRCIQDIKERLSTHLNVQKIKEHKTIYWEEKIRSFLNCPDLEKDLEMIRELEPSLVSRLQVLLDNR